MKYGPLVAIAFTGFLFGMWQHNYWAGLFMFTLPTALAYTAISVVEWTGRTR